MEAGKYKKFIKKYCKNCKHRQDGVCEIRTNIDNKLQCVNFERREKDEN